MYETKTASSVTNEVVQKKDYQNRRMSDITEAEQVHEPFLDFCENRTENNRE